MAKQIDCITVNNPDDADGSLNPPLAEAETFDALVEALVDGDYPAVVTYDDGEEQTGTITVADARVTYLAD